MQQKQMKKIERMRNTGEKAQTKTEVNKNKIKNEIESKSNRIQCYAPPIA